MKRYNFVLILLLAVVVFWAVLNENYSLRNIGLGFIIGIITLFITQTYVVDSEIPDIQLSLVAILMIYYVEVLVQIVKSSFVVFKAVLQNKHHVDRIEIKLPTNYKFINALICNTITLTPGTITLEIKENTAEVLVLNPTHQKKEVLIEQIESSFERFKKI